eukprot:GHVL01009335.1.p1 GENE.GHVL01009335.1~~GHVL01009335.1.p1  ORF type:complete len:116 (+),score=4.86 GHVL01009335.1:422-769(+)
MVRIYEEHSRRYFSILKSVPSEIDIFFAGAHAFARADDPMRRRRREEDKISRAENKMAANPESLKSRPPFRAECYRTTGEPFCDLDGNGKCRIQAMRFFPRLHFCLPFYVWSNFD